MVEARASEEWKCLEHTYSFWSKVTTAGEDGRNVPPTPPT